MSPTLGYGSIALETYTLLIQFRCGKSSINSSGDSVFKIESGNSSCSINGSTNWDAVDIGSQPLMLDPGTHTLRILTSAWSPIPDVEVSYRERWK